MIILTHMFTIRSKLKIPKIKLITDNGTRARVRARTITDHVIEGIHPTVDLQNCVKTLDIKSFNSIINLAKKQKQEHNHFDVEKINNTIDFYDNLYNRRQNYPIKRYDFFIFGSMTSFSTFHISHILYSFSEVKLLPFALCPLIMGYFSVICFNKSFKDSRDILANMKKTIGTISE